MQYLTVAVNPIKLFLRWLHFAYKIKRTELLTHQLIDQAPVSFPAALLPEKNIEIQLHQTAYGSPHVPGLCQLSASTYIPFSWTPSFAWLTYSSFKTLSSEDTSSSNLSSTLPASASAGYNAPSRHSPKLFILVTAILFHCNDNLMWLSSLPDTWVPLGQEMCLLFSYFHLESWYTYD